MRRNPTVLVVDNDPAVREPLKKFLALNGFDVVAADSAPAAIHCLATAAVDGAVVDLHLAEGSGRDVVLSIPPPIPVIIFSTVPDQSGRLERLRPNTRLVQKPFSLLMLVETLQRMIEAARRRSPVR